MGKRKSARVIEKKQVIKLDKEFDCPFCNFDKCVDVKMKKKEKIGEVVCRVCNVSWKGEINNLYKPCDIFADWIDACDRANKGK